MLVGADSGGQDLRDVRVRDYGESVVDGAGAVCIPFVVDLAEGEGKRENPVLVVHENLAEVAGLDPAEAHGRAGGKADGKDRCARVRPKGNEPCVPAHLYARFLELLGKGGSVPFRGHEHIEVLFLELQCDIRGDLLGRCGAENGGKPGSCAVHELHPALPHDDVVRSAQPEVFVVRIFGRQVKVGVVNVPDGLFALLGKEGGHSCVQAGSKIGKVDFFLGHGWEQFLALVQNRLHVFQLLYRKTGYPVDDGKIVARVGEGHFLIPAVFVHGLLPFVLDALVDFVCSSDRSGDDDF